MKESNKENRIVILVEWTGVTKEMYEKSRIEIDWEGNVPEGMVLHIATFDEKGIRVTDVWENEEYFNNFFQKRLMPVSDKLTDIKPKVEIYPLYALFIPES